MGDVAEEDLSIVRDNSHVNRDGSYITGQVIPDGKIAPTCFVEFHCFYVYPPKKKKRKLPPCDGGTTQNAYLGPIQCMGTEENPHPPTFMKPIRLVT